MSDAKRESLDLSFTPGEREQLEPIMNGLRAALGADGFSAAWAEGRSWSQQEAVAAARALRGDSVSIAAG